MKKLYILSVLLFFAAALFAQETVLQSKNGTPILPQKGDWAIGVDAQPFTNIFNQNSNMQFDFVNGMVLVGKKFISDNTAYRAKLRLNFTSDTDNEYIIQDGQAVPDPLITVTDTKLENVTNVAVAFGLEKRIGYGRLQAMYGGEFMYGFAALSESYTYGNAFSMTNPSPTTTNFGTNIPAVGERVIYAEDALDHMFALRAFLGIEYFVLPKVSIGGEFGWHAAYNTMSDGKEVVQCWDPSVNATHESVNEMAGGHGFDFDNDNFGGALFFMFHFQ